MTPVQTQVTELLRQGATRAEVLATLDITANQYHHILSKLRKSGATEGVFNGDRIDEDVRAMAETGMSNQQIRDELGLSKTRLDRAKKRLYDAGRLQRQRKPKSE